MKIKITALAVALAVTVSATATAQDAYKKCLYVAGTDTLLYRELAPEKAGSGKFPLVVFLHGAGERGCDNEKQLTHGAQMFLNPINLKKYQAYVIFPQCPDDCYGAYSEQPASFLPADMPTPDQPTKYVKMIRGLVSKYIHEKKVEPTQVYLVGLSMGAMTLYDLAARYPTMWAAAVAICGTVNTDRLEPARDIKFRIYHGDADMVVPVEAGREIYLKLKKLNTTVEYVEYPAVAHGSWVNAFGERDFLKWIFSQSAPAQSAK